MAISTITIKNMQDIRKLKIELRAVPYSTSSDVHVLEYRFSPDQDLKYYKEYNWFFGLIKFGVVKKYSTSWKCPHIFFNGVISYKYPEDDNNNDTPIFVRSRDQLNKLKDKFKTYGDFLDWYLERDAKERAEYRKARKEFLDKQTIWK